MKKDRLNLLVDRAAIERARRYSHLHQTSISRLVSDYLSQLPVEEESREGIDEMELTPTVRRLLGVARGDLDREDYRHHLLENYGQ